MDSSEKLNDKKILVTGGLGFIGKNLIKKLINFNCKIIIIDDCSNSSENVLNEFNSQSGKLEFHKFSVVEREKLNEFLRNVNYIFHLACVQISKSSSNPYEDLQVNAISTLNILEYFRNNKNTKLERILYTSTSSIYGNAKSLPIKEDDSINIMSHYAASKYLAENYIRLYSALYNIPTVVVRFSNVYGYGQSPLNPYCGVLGKFIHNALTGEKLIIFGDGEQTRDYTFIDDAVDAVLKAIVSPKAIGEVFNIGTEVETSVNKLVDIIKKFVPEIEVQFLPERDIDNVRRRSVDISRIRSKLNWSPNININKGIEKTINWYKSFLQ